MKLIFCRDCYDLVALKVRPRRQRCVCGKSWGRYLPLPPDAPSTALNHAEIGGRAMGVGIHNDDLAAAAGAGNLPAEPPIEAWVLSAQEPTLTIHPARP